MISFVAGLFGISITRVWIYLIIALAFTGFCGTIYYKGYSHCSTKVEIDTLKNTIDIKGKQDEVRNKHIDDEFIINSLQQGKF